MGNASLGGIADGRPEGGGGRMNGRALENLNGNRGHLTRKGDADARVGVEGDGVIDLGRETRGLPMARHNSVVDLRRVIVANSRGSARIDYEAAIVGDPVGLTQGLGRDLPVSKDDKGFAKRAEKEHDTVEECHVGPDKANGVGQIEDASDVPAREGPLAKPKTRTGGQRRLDRAVASDEGAHGNAVRGKESNAR